MGGREGGRKGRGEERRNLNRKVCFSSARSHSLLAVLSRPSSSHPDARCSTCGEKPPREGGGRGLSRLEFTSCSKTSAASHFLTLDHEGFAPKRHSSEQRVTKCCYATIWDEIGLFSYSFKLQAQWLLKFPFSSTKLNILAACLIRA